jgi:hypothetical protein
LSQRESCEEYSFYVELEEGLDDGLCQHCSKYLTVHCPQIDDFLEGGLDE